MEGILRATRLENLERRLTTILKKVEEIGLALQWIVWMMERAGTKNGNNKGWQLWQQHNHPIELSDNFY